jgi:2-dehydropantoate 2-reductase
MKTDTQKQPQGASYLIIGSGRLATHLAHYFSLLELKFQKWNRTESPLLLAELLESKPLVILAISDSALESFYQEFLYGRKLTVVHCSGSFNSEAMISCHPLMTFGKELYHLETYKNIFFAVTGVSSFQTLFPGLPNSFFQIKPEDKSLYHALCVLSAAGAQKIWSQSEILFSQMGVPSQAFSPYIRQIAENYIASGSAALTGPWARGDEKTISQNLNALVSKSDSLHRVYELLKEG